MKILTKGTYYGKQDSEVCLNDIILSQYDYTADKTDWHYHENPYFWFVLNGNMMDCNKKVTTLVPQGSLMFNNWQEVHYGSKHSEKASGFHLEFQKKWFVDNDIDIGLFEGNKLIQNPRIHFLFVKLYYEFTCRDQYSEMSVEFLLIEVCAILSEIKETNLKNIPNWVDDLKELVHFDNSNLSLQYLSNQLEVHPVHISRAAPKYLSMSLGEYIRQTKLKKAIPLLLDPSISLTEIAYQSGFSDQSHFNRVFKSYLNMNPSAFQNSLNIK